MTRLTVTFCFCGIFPNDFDGKAVGTLGDVVGDSTVAGIGAGVTTLEKLTGKVTLQVKSNPIVWLKVLHLEAQANRPSILL